MSIIKLSPEDKIIVKQCFESLNNTDLWGPHDGFNVNGSPSLQSGKTIWLRRKPGPWRLQEVNEVCLLKNILSKYQTLLRPDIQEGVTHFFGRVYLHRLQPGQFIGRHYDYNDQPYFSYLTRFQLYSDIPEGNIIEMDPKVEENSFLHFNHNAWHEYQNNSNENLYFIVYDLVSNEIKKIN